MSITVTDLSKNFGDQLVVNRINLTVENGEMFVLLGSSGSGKSTLLRLIAGLLHPDAGKIQLQGVDVTNIPTQKRGVGFVFQQYAIFKHMTVLENVGYGLKIRKIAKLERTQRCLELLEMVGLSGLEERYPSQLSGGQRQRVALARALAYKPSVLLLDEPFGALDPEIRGRLRRRLRRIQRQLGVTTVLVTHDQEEAFELGDRIGVLERGRLIEMGRPDELYHTPQTEFVANFIGGGNVLVGRYNKGNINVGDSIIPLPPEAPKHDEGAPVRILFRPETVAYERTPFTRDSGVFTLGQGKIADRIFSGATERFRFEIEDFQGMRAPVPRMEFGRRATIINVTSTRPNDVANRYEIGEKLWLGIKRFHVLQPSSLRILMVHESYPQSIESWRTVPALAQSSFGLLTVLRLIEDSEKSTGESDELVHLKQQIDSAFKDIRVELRVRNGDFDRQILREIKEYFYDLVAVHRSNLVIEGDDELTSTTFEILSRRRLPVLVLGDGSKKISKILICTAAGEPGKNDIRLGARIAHHADAEVCVINITGKYATPMDVARVERHLAEAQATLESLDIDHQIKVEGGNLIEKISAELNRNNYDLVVVGAPAPGSKGRLLEMLLERKNLSVLVVPIAELEE